MASKLWYAVMYDRDDNDWGFGAENLELAIGYVRELRADGFKDAYIAIIDGGVCVDEITEV